MKQSLKLMLFLITMSFFTQLANAQIQYFGYAYGHGASIVNGQLVESTADLPITSPYTNFSQTDGVYGQSLVARVNTMKSYGVKALIDLGKVLWCSQDNYQTIYLCSDYSTRWQNWASLNQSVLNPGHVAGFIILGEGILYGISRADIEAAAHVVKQSYPSIPNLVIEASVTLDQVGGDPNRLFDPERLPRQDVDWFGLDRYSIHPLTDPTFQSDMAKLKNKYPQKGILYIMDGTWDSYHIPVAPTVNDMAQISQEWYQVAKCDPQAVALGVFIWPRLGSGGPPTSYVSKEFPSSVLSVHQSIGLEIKSSSPVYQGYLDATDCTYIRGWAWNSKNPAQTVSVDIYDGSTKIATVAANTFRSDLVSAGICPGTHGFFFPTPENLKGGVSHSISVKFAGTSTNLSSSPKTLNCPAVYEGYHDSADCNSIIGWAWDSNRPNTPINVNIYDGSALLAGNVPANQFRQDLLNAGKGNGYHGFGYQVPCNLRNGQTHSITIKFAGTSTNLTATPKSFVCTATTTSIAWIQPAEVTFGPPGTLTVAGYAKFGTGGVQMYWRDATAGSPWTAVAYQPVPDANGVWYNTIPAPINKCHRYEVYSTYCGATSTVFAWNGPTAGYCTESAKVIWVAPQPIAGFGPPGSLVIAGNAFNAPAGYGVQLWWRDVTANGAWSALAYQPPPGSNGIWYNSIANANYYHQYAVYVKYDVITSSTCTYAGNNTMTSCP